MKIPTSRSRNGFTLVELLVVILIIAVLASAGFAVGTAAINKARKTTAQATAVAVETAVNNFFTDNSTMPSIATSDSASSGLPTDSGEGKDLVTVLLALETAATPMNQKLVKYLNAKEGKNNKNGLIYSSDGKSVEGLFDPWGGAFKVVMDGDYDEKITVKPKAGTQKVLNKRVACWSDGADGAKSGVVGKAADDVITWN